ncbi:MAG: hypothetical protein H6908_03475 [Hyphomicrobiales bacterium]|nr:hypothetical protein [Hyphomicrobiales bacterium]
MGAGTGRSPLSWTGIVYNISGQHDDNAYSQLLRVAKKFVTENNIKIIHVDSPPRAASTAFFRALEQDADASIFEPFLDRPPNFENGCSRILETLKHYKTEHGIPPKTLVAKDVSRYIKADDWAQWLDVIYASIVLIRDPFTQLNSLLRRKAHEYANNYTGDNLSTSEVMSLAPNVDQMLLTGRPNDESASPFYGTSGWKNLKEHVDTTAPHFQKHHEKKLIIVDTTLLRIMPTTMMQEITSYLGMKYSKRLVSGWGNTGAVINNNSAWYAKAALSDGFLLPTDPYLTLNDMPNGMKEHAIKQALPIYIELLNHPARVGPKDSVDLRRILATKIDGTKTFSDFNPITAYTLLTLNDKLSFKKIEKDLRVHFPNNIAVFDIIDQLAKNAPNTTKWLIK